MPHFLLSVMRPAGWSAGEDPEMMPRIDALNDGMVAAGVRVYVGGLADPAKAIRCPPDEFGLAMPHHRPRELSGWRMDG